MNRVGGGVVRAKSRRSWLWSGAVASVAVLVAAAVVARSGDEPRAAAVVAGSEGAPGAAVTPGPAATAVDQWEFVVFLCTPSSAYCRKRGATDRQREALQTHLEAMPELTGLQFLDRAAMYAAFRRDFAGHAPLLKKVKRTDLSESFRFKVKQGTDRDRVRSDIFGRPGVGYVADLAEVHGDPMAVSPEWDAVVFICVTGTAMPACASGRGRKNKKAATPGEKKAIVAALDRTPEVVSYVFEDQKTAYRKFAEDFSHKQELVDATKVADMPESYRLRLRPEADWNALTARLARMPGVSQAYNQRCADTKVKLVEEYGFDDVPGAGVVDEKACAPGTG
ncbi:hypothetical protein ETD86_33525 [Nonomuraea turkmeniaca]|uniref:FtsX extracellular domain-containing protein n=1 Tax=Nonomuraea turkmeniaca TaxID=103838 RepID=A0A5S4F7N7_9ACTN|nr:permease-like cell division protein FtsX [Nonomuraea turkmeniaca]TMR12155.1 hypothetical protein ETD86_33525 [Nonomuraea turkmeniaca]